MSILNLGKAPRDPVALVVYLDGVQEQVQRELDHAYEEAYFRARLERRFDSAVAVGRASRKRALAWTRRANERRGRAIRWNDSLDPTSTAYEPPSS